MFKKYSQFVESKSELLNENVQLAKRYLVDNWIEKNNDKLFEITPEDIKLINEDPKFSKVKSFIERNPVDGLDVEKIKEIKLNLVKSGLNPNQVRQIENTPNFLKLKEMLQRNQGWVYNFTVFHFGEEIPMEELTALYKLLIDNRDLLDRLPQTVDKYFEYEKLVDDLENVGRYRKAKALLNEIPGEVKREAENASVAMKKKIEDLAFEFYALKPELQKNFIKKIARYRTLLSLTRALETYIKASAGANLSGFVDKVADANRRFGEKRGAEILFLNEDTQKMIIELKSWEACKALCSNTSWCIASSSSQWNNYVGGDSVFTKQYIILDFSLSPTDNYSIIGITVNSDNRFRASHLKDDSSIQEANVRKRLDAEENAILKGMTKAEMDQKTRLVTASKEIKKPGVSIELLDKFLTDGADINVDGGTPIKNAIKENNYDKTKFLLDKGASVHLGESSSGIIDSCLKNPEGKRIMLLLIEYGADITRTAYKNHATDVETIKHCVDKGIDINFDDGLPLRAAAKIGNLDIVRYIVENGGDMTRKEGMALQWASEYGHVNVVKYLVVDKQLKSGLVRATEYLFRRLDVREKENKKDLEEYNKSDKQRKEMYKKKLDEYDVIRPGYVGCVKLLMDALKTNSPTDYTRFLEMIKKNGYTYLN